MINRDTVFILGAGASKPYNFPTGDELKEKICDKFINDLRRFPIIGITEPELKEELIKQRNDAAKKFVDSLRGATGQSIDLFLKINKSHLKVGKIAILNEIFKAEKESQFRLRSDDWYVYLFERLMDECWRTENPEHITKNKISFITFNYDRSLEQFFADSFLNNFSDYDDKSQLYSYLNSIPINHVYGCLGRLSWQKNPKDDDVMDFGNLNPEYILKEKAQANIKLIDERKTVDAQKLKNLLMNAERIFILGFAFLQENLEVLNLLSSLPTHRTLEIYATTLGMHPQRVEEVKSYLYELKPSPQIELEPITAYQLLYKFLWN